MQARTHAIAVAALLAAMLPAPAAAQRLGGQAAPRAPSAIWRKQRRSVGLSQLRRRSALGGLGRTVRAVRGRLTEGTTARSAAPERVAPRAVPAHSALLSQVAAAVRQDARDGNAARAADGFVALRRQLGDVREVRRLGREVASAARQLADERSSAGYVEGTRDAVAAIRILDEGRGVGFVQRWRARRAENRAFSRLLTESRHAVDEVALERARAQLELAVDMRGEGRQVRRAARQLYDRSMRAAKALSRAGDPNTTLRVLEVAGSQAARVGMEQRFQDRAEGLMKTAVENALPVLTRRARELYEARWHEDAAGTLLGVLEMQRSTGVAPSRRVAREQAALARLLAPEIARAQEAARAQAAANAQAAPAAASPEAPAAP